ncbi:MAG: hypothetical protein Q4G08_00475 [Capnocytophaga sp.]|nr:hypothetical protein [Capnocytophaga sp.]
MTEIDKINEELRNYKLFKIQRINVKEKEFSELKKDLLKIQRNEILSYVIATLNLLAVIFLIYNIVKSISNPDFYQLNKELIIINFFIITVLSVYFTIAYLLTTKALKKHIKSSENAVAYFASESEKLKAIYENYIENYLDEVKKGRVR